MTPILIDQDRYSSLDKRQMRTMALQHHTDSSFLLALGSALKNSLMPHVSFSTVHSF